MFATSKHFWGELTNTAQRRLGDFNAQNLANTVWAFARAIAPASPLLVVVGRTTERHLGKYNAQDFANTV